MFDKSGLTVNDVIEMVVAYYIKFGISQEARCMLMEMLKICAGPEFQDLKISNHKLSKVFDPPSSTIMYHFYCEMCKKELVHSSTKDKIKGQKSVCKNCENECSIALSNRNMFLTVDLEYQLKSLLEKEDIIQFFVPENILKERNADIMHDVHDSLLGIKTVKEYSSTITYAISTDGAPLFNVSKRGFWPLQIMLNNLPVNLRFKYVLLSAVMVVSHEPNPNLMNLFINEFVKQAEALHSKGINIKVESENRELNLRFTPLFIVADSVAKPILQNRFQFNGFFGCSYCYHRGVYINKKGMKFPFLSVAPELRTHYSHMKDVEMTILYNKEFNGVKGSSVFQNLPNIDMVWSFILDYLHNAVLGVTQQVWSFFYKQLKPAQRKIIDERLLKILVPRELRRVLLKISEKSLWKGTHWKSWMLYLCLPLCSDLISIELLEHFALFVNSMYTLLKMSITLEELDKCEQDLMSFVAKYEILYGTESMTFNVHALLHLRMSVELSGPLWATSAFPFENNIFSLKQTINGPKSVEQQMTTKSLNLLKYRIMPPNDEMSEKAKQYCASLFMSKTFTASATKIGNVTLFGPNPKNIFSSVTEKEFERCIYENRIYSSTKYLRSKKFDDTVVKLKTGKIVQITGIFVLPNNTCRLSIEELKLSPFIIGKTQVFHVWIVNENIDHSPITLSDIDSKVVVIDLKSKQYVCEIPNSIEAQ